MINQTCHNVPRNERVSLTKMRNVGRTNDCVCGCAAGGKESSNCLCHHNLFLVARVDTGVGCHRLHGVQCDAILLAWLSEPRPREREFYAYFSIGSGR